MKRLFALMGVLVLSASVHATSITSYSVRADVDRTGDAKVSVRVQLEAAQAGRLLIPLGFERVSKVLPGGLALGAAITLTGDARKQIEVILPAGIASDAELVFSFETTKLMVAPKPELGKKPELAADTQLLKHSFVNTQAATIGSYRVEVVLPEGIQVQTVREQTPKPKRSDVLPRVQLGAHEGRQTAVLQMEDVKQGDRTTMTLETVTEQRSWAWLLAGLALSLFYLIKFKDLIARPTSS